jgi:hypothetical protein
VPLDVVGASHPEETKRLCSFKSLFFTVLFSSTQLFQFLVLLVLIRSLDACTWLVETVPPDSKRSSFRILLKLSGLLVLIFSFDGHGWLTQCLQIQTMLPSVHDECVACVEPVPGVDHCKGQQRPEVEQESIPSSTHLVQATLHHMFRKIPNEMRAILNCDLDHVRNDLELKLTTTWRLVAVRRFMLMCPGSALGREKSDEGPATMGPGGFRNLRST